MTNLVFYIREERNIMRLLVYSRTISPPPALESHIDVGLPYRMFAKGRGYPQQNRSSSFHPCIPTKAQTPADTNN